MGSYGRGARNFNGENLVTFASHFDVVLANTCFQHAHRHRSTWEGILATGKKIYNMIDYILVPQKLRSALRQARSYAGLLTDSDHRLVVCKLELNHLRICWRPIASKSRRVAAKDLKAHAKDFQDRIAFNFSEHPPPSEASPLDALSTLNENLLAAAFDTIGPIEAKKSGSSDPVFDLSLRQKALRDKLRAAKDPEVIRALRGERQRLMREIHKRTRQNAIQRIDEQVKQLERLKDDARMFQAVQTLRSTNRSALLVTDQEGKFVSSAQEKADIVATFFKGQLADDKFPHLAPFAGTPSPLSVPISFEEVDDALRTLKCNKAPGPDDIAAELYKCAGRPCIWEIVSILNDAFASHTDIDVGSGVLCPISKPGKPKGPCTSLRPVILLKAIRKVLSLVVLKRLSPKLEPKISAYQSGFRPGRSTTEIVWAKRWLISIALLYEVDIYFLGIDLSRAFDRVVRARLLHSVASTPGVTEDDTRMVRLLLTDSKLRVRVANTLSSPFDGNMGTPQGDGLSPFLFIFYLDEAMKASGIMAADKQNRPPLDCLLRLPALSGYADDVDLYSTSDRFLDQQFDSLKVSFGERNLIINDDKTERVHIHRPLPKDVCPDCRSLCSSDTVQCDGCDAWWHFRCSGESKESLALMLADPHSTFVCPKCQDSKGVSIDSEKWKHVKSLGSLLGDKEDLDRRIQLGAAAFRQHFKIWPRRSFISLQLRMRIYNSFVLPVLTYNIATLALSQTLANKLDAFHRRQLRMVTGKLWPEHISNDALYALTKSAPLSKLAKERRWVFFGHVCRLPPDAPARLAMHSFFAAADHLSRRRGRPPSCLYGVLAADLLSSFDSHHLLLRTAADLRELELRAADRKRWEKLVRQVCGFS